MPRGRKIVKVIEIEESTLAQALDEFCRHNHIKGLAKETQKQYRIVVGNFVKCLGENNPVSMITEKSLDEYL